MMENVADLHLKNAECPVWHPIENALYWADIPNGHMYRFDPAVGRSERVWEGRPLGALVVQKDGSLLQFLDEGRVQIWRAGEVSVVCESMPEVAGTRFNDGLADPQGRVLAGTMPDDQGRSRLFRFALDGSYEVLLSNMGQSNGLCFDNTARFLYVTDTKKKTITRFVYGDLLTQPKIVVRVESEGKPDGLAMDSDGRLWSAHWGGSCVVIYDSFGGEVERVELQTPKVSSVAFGGPELRDVYVTTASSEDGSGGALFRMRSEVAGKPVFLGQLFVRGKG